MDSQTDNPYASPQCYDKEIIVSHKTIERLMAIWACVVGAFPGPVLFFFLFAINTYRGVPFTAYEFERMMRTCIGFHCFIWILLAVVGTVKMLNLVIRRV